MNSYLVSTNKSLIKMPKKHKIMNKLPENLSIECAIGPLQIKRCGNSGHVIVPCKFVGIGTVYVLICK